MGMNAGGAKGGRKQPMSEINVTPMVDVMLVLLVIFMITAPSIKQIEALEVNLPQLQQGESAETILTEDACTVPITADGQVGRPGSKKLDDHYENLTQLQDDLKVYKEESEKAKKQAVVVIAGDREAKYERVIQVWNAVKRSGIRHISFQVEGKAAEAPAAAGKQP